MILCIHLCLLELLLSKHNQVEQGSEANIVFLTSPVCYTNIFVVVVHNSTFVDSVSKYIRWVDVCSKHKHLTVSINMDSVLVNGSDGI